ncbi:MAG: 4-hydroxy-tetrahydrodipicolinate synthase [Kosmotogaceae bacterium]
MVDVVKHFGRVLIPMNTAFKEDYEIDYSKTKMIARFLIKKDYCDSLIVAGTNGEFYTMSFEEKVKLFEAVKEEVGNERPLIAGTGTAFTEETIKLTKEAERIGYDAAMVVVPYYCHPTQNGVKNHFMRVANSTNLPIMVYNIPLFTATNIEPETLGELSGVDNIVAVKDEAGINPLQTSAFLNATNGKMVVYSGDDLMVLSVLTQGGVGVVSGGSHVIGDIMKGMLKNYFSGNVQEATQTFKKLYNLFKAFFGRDGRFENPLPGVKKAFALHSGIDVARVRPPLEELQQDEIELLKESLEKNGKI